ncbi:hypothetical protein CYLTODRAFT_425418 [Cylindrobasidium torrendii FP15055 ss-10]|uniref:Zf-MIZ-domain-containing protein n=1 Tax=Cylindrobasidium torrendii FP15055 ss-10 TaxID=1314674 RepID=A0A0D7B245_9AGAR|nr:hypothetical protein CYLTODRAFT_425418 [Cylindrobasidium torrendii FP15055 ss-10]
MAMATNDWDDFATVHANVRANTVDRLKQITMFITEECGAFVAKTGKKMEIIARIQAQLEAFRNARDVKNWLTAKQICEQIRTVGFYTRASRMPTNPSAAGLPRTSNYPPAPHASAPRYDPYAASRGPLAAGGSGSYNQASTSTKPTLSFKDSPFFSIEQTISTVVECPESNSSTDRRQQSLHFTLTQDHITKLNSPSPKYQIRLFCTSSTFYSPTPQAFRTMHGPALMEFPPTCEVRVNDKQIQANLKGLKKKPGTAPPPNIISYVRLNTSANKVDIVYVNSQQPAATKKYYLVVQLVKTTSIDSLVNKLKTENVTTAETVVARMKASVSAADDDDIIAGPQKMSLKCPLSFMRVNTPCRSSKCVHPQCFDATSWFSMMEQTTTWLCPVCEKALDTKELVIDGYFAAILKACPDSVDDVYVEADGEWHTDDNKYGSAAWTATHPYKAQGEAPKKAPEPARTSSQCKAAAPLDTASIVVLDSDDEDEDRVKGELSPSMPISGGSSLPPPPTPAPGADSSDVIDLTLDSDDEDGPPPPSAASSSKQPQKRKASEEPVHVGNGWKRSRTLPEDDLTGAPGFPPSHSESVQRPAANDAHRYGASSTLNAQPLYLPPAPAAPYNAFPNPRAPAAPQHWPRAGSNHPWDY